jgi:hypothetical protein
MKVGDLIDIYYTPFEWMSGLIDKQGIISEIVGYKTTILVDGELENWDLSDLAKMKKK